MVCLVVKIKMPISATGRNKTRAASKAAFLPMRRQYEQSGFTLIELLAVVLLVGIAASVVMVSIGTGGQAQQLRADARYLYNGIAAALEEAVISQQQIGLRFDMDTSDGETLYYYNWLILDRQAQQWQELTNEALQGKTFASGISVVLQVDGDELIIGGKNEDSFFTLKQSTDNNKPALQPDIYFLSSGEMANFTITLKEQESENHFTISGNLLGQLQFSQGDEDKH